MNEVLHVDVTYRVKPGLRDEFYKKVMEAGIAKASRNEERNLKYEYSMKEEFPNDVFLTEIWATEEAQIAHGITPHYQKLAELKKLYVSDTQIKKSLSQ